MKCDSCGATTFPDERICRYCGNKIINLQNNKPVQNINKVRNKDVYYNYADYNDKMNIKIIIIVFTILLFLATLLLFLILSIQNKINNIQRVILFLIVVVEMFYAGLSIGSAYKFYHENQNH